MYQGTEIGYELNIFTLNLWRQQLHLCLSIKPVFWHKLKLIVIINVYCNLCCYLKQDTLFYYLFLFFCVFYRATVIENSKPVEKNLPLSILMSSLPPTGGDAQEQNKERLSTGTKFALRQWLKLVYSPPPGDFQRGDSYNTVFQGITKAGHQPVKSPFWGK